MSDEHKESPLLQAHQIEELYSEQEASEFAPIPIGLKIGIYTLLLFVVLFIASVFVIKIEVTREFSVFLFSVKNPKQVELRVVGTECLVFSEGQRARMKIRSSSDISVTISNVSEEINSDDCTVLVKLLSHNDEDVRLNSLRPNTYQKLVVVMGKQSLFDILFNSAI